VPFVNRLDAETDRVRRAARRDRSTEARDAHAADALVRMMKGAGKRAPRADVVYVCDLNAAARGQTEGHELCHVVGGGPVPVSVVREAAVGAFVKVAVRDGKQLDTIVHYGRRIPAELRTALIVSGRECSIDGCTGREYLELDHCEVDHFNGGPTALWNLAWECSIHHERKTQGWILGPPDPVTGKRRLDPPGHARAA
jgi:hypothetical protein